MTKKLGELLSHEQYLLSEALKPTILEWEKRTGLYITSLDVEHMRHDHDITSIEVNTIDSWRKLK